MTRQTASNVPALYYARNVLTAAEYKIALRAANTPYSSQDTLFGADALAAYLNSLPHYVAAYGRE